MLLDCPVRNQHYAVGEMADGRWVFAWGPRPWPTRISSEPVAEPRKGFTIYSSRGIALSVLRQTVEAHHDLRRFRLVRKWECEDEQSGRRRLPLAA